jgi:hypothetical protein
MVWEEELNWYCLSKSAIFNRLTLFYEYENNMLNTIHFLKRSFSRPTGPELSPGRRGSRKNEIVRPSSHINYPQVSLLCMCMEAEIWPHICELVT